MSQRFTDPQVIAFCTFTTCRLRKDTMNKLPCVDQLSYKDLYFIKYKQILQTHEEEIYE